MLNFEITPLDALGLIIGLIYLYFEYNANRLVWIVGVIMPLNSLIVFFEKGLYADFAINIYYLLIAIYGFWAWSRKKHSSTGDTPADPGDTPAAKTALQITHTPWRMYIPLTAALLALWALLWWILTTFTNSTVPVTDSFTTALSIVAYWMMARKYAEQWLAWFVVDAIYVGLYIYKDLVFYPVLYTVYTVIAIFGYRRWCREAVRAGDYEA